MDEAIGDEAQPSVGSRVEVKLQVVHVREGESDDEGTDSEERELLEAMFKRIAVHAVEDPVAKMLFAADAEELTRRSRARAARKSRLQQPLHPASGSNRRNHDEVNGNAIRSRRLGRSTSPASSLRSRGCLSLTVRLTETSIKRYVENVIRRSVMEGRSPRCV